MRILAVLAAALLLSGCTWLREEFGPVPPVAPAPARPAVEPPRPPRKPAPEHVERLPPAPPPQSVSATPVPPTDYSSRCHAMADSRADDARQLGAAGADLAKVQQDVYHDCMSQSVKPSQ